MHELLKLREELQKVYMIAMHGKTHRDTAKYLAQRIIELDKELKKVEDDMYKQHLEDVQNDKAGANDPANYPDTAFTFKDVSWEEYMDEHINDMKGKV